jgi:hypothetical protein
MFRRKKIYNLMFKRKKSNENNIYNLMFKRKKYTD